jgi:hypothetical protein
MLVLRRVVVHRVVVSTHSADVKYDSVVACSAAVQRGAATAPCCQRLHHLVHRRRRGTVGGSDPQLFVRVVLVSVSCWRQHCPTQSSLVTPLLSRPHQRDDEAKKNNSCEKSKQPPQPPPFVVAAAVAAAAGASAVVGQLPAACTSRCWTGCWLAHGRVDTHKPIQALARVRVCAKWQCGCTVCRCRVAVVRSVCAVVPCWCQGRSCNRRRSRLTCCGCRRLLRSRHNRWGVGRSCSWDCGWFCRWKQCWDRGGALGGRHGGRCRGS